jgi:hypothetical protein
MVDGVVDALDVTDFVYIEERSGTAGFYIVSHSFAPLQTYSTSRLTKFVFLVTRLVQTPRSSSRVFLYH